LKEARPVRSRAHHLRRRRTQLLKARVLQIRSNKSVDPSDHAVFLPLIIFL